MSGMTEEQLKKLCEEINKRPHEDVKRYVEEASTIQEICADKDGK